MIERYCVLLGKRKRGNLFERKALLSLRKERTVSSSPEKEGQEIEKKGFRFMGDGREKKNIVRCSSRKEDNCQLNSSKVHFQKRDGQANNINRG
jgi:hypothetical protein